SSMADQGDDLISIVAAALTATDADARDRPDAGLIFRPEWRPTPRTRSSPSQLQGTPAANQSWSLLGLIRQWSQGSTGPQPQQDQPVLPPGPPRERTPQSASAPPPRSTSEYLRLDLNFKRMPSQYYSSGTRMRLTKLENIYRFPRALGDGTASLDGFRYYMIQDKLYLETCARLKMIAVAASPDVEDVKTFGSRHKSSLEYIQKLQDICVTMLGIPVSTITSTQPSVQLDTSERFYKETLRLANDDVLLAFVLIRF
ncbi:hypothetical protein GGX14DRAFT_444650, partial [Mycena pura]